MNNIRPHNRFEVNEKGRNLRCGPYYVQRVL